jgi:hypothetical protein
MTHVAECDKTGPYNGSNNWYSGRIKTKSESADTLQRPAPGPYIPFYLVRDAIEQSSRKRVWCHISR